jgi:hypothetical protein
MVALAIAVGATIFSLTQTSPSISDTIGYAYAGQRLASRDGLTYLDPNNELAGPYFSLYAFQIRRPEDPRMYLGFPPGFPMLLLAGIRLTGNLQTIHYVVPFLAIVGLVFTFYLGKLVTGSLWGSVWAGVLLVASAAFWEYSTSLWSEIPSLTFVTAGICFFLLGYTPERPRRQVVLFSLLGGICLAYSFFIRYSNVVVVAPLALYALMVDRRQLYDNWARLVFFVPVGLGFVGMLLFNYLYYGGITTTSYSAVHGWYPWSAFSWRYALGPSFVGGYSLIETFKTLWYNFPGVVLLIPLGWLILPRRMALLLAGVSLAKIGLYAVYAFPPTGVNSRFLLPIFPFLSASIAAVIVYVGTKIPDLRWRWAAAIVLLALLAYSVPVRAGQLRVRNAQDKGLVEHVKAMTADTPADAVFLSYSFNDHLVYYGQRSVLNYRRIPTSDREEGRYLSEMLEPCLVQTVDRLLQADKHVYYIEDSTPPFWNSLEILQRNYAMVLFNPPMKIYRIEQQTLSRRDHNPEPPCRQ